MLYDYECQDCKKITETIHLHKQRPMVQCEVCKGWNTVKLIGSPVPLGTRDSFGISKSFQDENTGETIDNWKSWEKAGYRQPLDTIKTHHVREKVKEKLKKIKKEK